MQTEFPGEHADQADHGAAQDAPIAGTERRGEERPRRRRRYCTYFDVDYAVRGLLMMRSLRGFEPDAAIHALCLDDTAARIVRDMDPLTEVTVLEELEAFDQALLTAKSNRSLVEFFFTCTPCFPRYLLARHPDTETITYLDADMLFFDAPERIFRETGEASIAIVPHNFTPSLSANSIYGTYNVSWVMWRNDEEGRRCLDEYRVDCLEWCHDRPECGRFADQKYLDTWPTRYRNVHAVRAKGVNLALWNIDNYDVRTDGSTVTVDGEPLVLFHYHALRHTGHDRYAIGIHDYGVTRNAGFVQDVLYRPYTQRVNELFKELAPVYGLSITATKRDQGPVPIGSGGDVSGGYEIVDRDSAAIAEEAWLHEDVADRQDRAYALLLEEARHGRVRVDLAVAAAAVHEAGVQRPSLLEIGCGSGYYSDVFGLLVDGGVSYTGLDSSPTMIARARCKYPDTPFVIGDAAALPFGDRAFDIAVNGASLMHTLAYPAAVAEMRRVSRRACVFHTVPMLTDRPTAYIRKHAYGRPVSEVIFNRDELFALFAAQGLVVRREWDSIPYDLRFLFGSPTLSRTILCEVTA